jgi:fructokinase
MLRFGIDLGGTKTEIIALDADGRERLRRRVATPTGSYADMLAAIVSLVRDAETELGETGAVGIASPGALSRVTGRIKNANSTCLNGQPLVEDLQRELGREIRLENDANCFALSEATDGAAAGAAIVFGVILGTGVGGGVVVRGETLMGANAIGGEWGHNPLPMPRDDERPGHRCYCGRDGCIETWLSGPGMAKHFLETDGRALDAATIARAAAEGNASAEAAMSAYEHRLAKSLASVINLLDPDVIVLGGGLSKIARLYDNVPKLWIPYVFSDGIVTRLLPPKFGDSSGVRGAAWLWNRP